MTTRALATGLFTIVLLVFYFVPSAGFVGAPFGDPGPRRAIQSLQSVRSSEASVQTTATVWGTITHDGSPVSGVQVQVIWDGGDQSTATDGSGLYSVGGVPTGGPIQIFVRPSTSDPQRLVFRNWRIDPLSGDLQKDFDLVSGYRLQGEFRKPDGTAYAQTFWLEANPLDFSTLPDEWIGITAFGGQFDVVVPLGIFRLNTNPSPRPYYMPSTKVDLRNGDRIGVVIALLDEMSPPFPTAPPRAGLIAVGSPDVDGNATVTGAAGAVESLAGVAVINLSTYALTTTLSDASGAFTATLYAPPGSSLMVKYDEEGGRISLLWEQAQAGLPDAAYLNPLPGTIIQVWQPPPGDGATQPFYSAGFWGRENPKAWAGWWLSGTLQVPPNASHLGLHVQQGMPVTLTARLHATSPAIDCTGAITLTPWASIGLQHLFEANGRAKPWRMWFTSFLFTPTGLPIEHEGGGENVSTGYGDFRELTCVSGHSFVSYLQTTFNVPDDLPDGIYLPQAYLNSGDIPLATTVPMVRVWYHWEPIASMPPLTVGSPALGHIPATLLGDYPVNGHRGVQAREDVGRYAVPTRVVFPPHRVVVPRLAERTGEPLIYRLEPGFQWLSGTDRRQPNPPHIPLRLPSGALAVEVFKPDGSSDVLGPSAVLQSLVRTPTLPGGTDLDSGTGQIGDLYHLTTLNDDFAYSFDQYGPHVISVNGEVNDIYGNPYFIEGTYDVTVARILDLDPAQLPTTPYQQGDAFAPGLHVFPPVPADVTVRLVQMPYSDPAQAITSTITGRANRFGYFQPPVGTVITMTAPGEFRVDITAVYEATDGTLWMGSVTWGNVVEGPAALIEAHGRRGMDYKSDTIDDMPAWFTVFGLLPEKVGIENYYPYFSGDIHWGNEDRQPGDSIHSIVTIRDMTGVEAIYDLMRGNWTKAKAGFRWPPNDTSLVGLDKRLEVDEAPLFITTRSGIDAAVAPEDVDLWGYWYGSSERPDVHVREIISEDNMGTAYWRFNDTYGHQIGESAEGDLPGDLKWEFGGAVFRVISETNPVNEYAIYSSLWVLLPHGDPVGARVTPPFQDATGLLNGGPIMTLQGEDIDMLFLPKGVRPGDVLEVGDVVAFSGHVGPPLDSQVGVTITAPSGEVLTRAWRANRIGWLYDPLFDFVANQTGRWTVDVSVLHDQPYIGNGVTPHSHNTGTVLGTSGRYEFYVVPTGSPRLSVSSPQPGFLSWPDGSVEPIPIRGTAPGGTTAVRYTIHDKGVVMAQGSVVPDASGVFTVTYDAKALNAIFPFVSLTAHEGIWEGLSDEVAINMLAVGGSEMRANTVTLIGEEVFVNSNPTNRVYLPVVLKGY